MCVGWEETRRTSAVVPSTSPQPIPDPQPVPDSDALSDIVIFSSSHHSWATHVSDTQPSRVLDTPHEESQDTATLDWDADYEMNGDEGGFGPPNRRSTTTDTSQREVSHPRTQRSTTARLARSSVTHTPPTSSLPRPSPTYVSILQQSTPPPPSIPPPDSPFDRFLSLGDLPTVHKPLSGPSAGVFAGCVERLAEAFLAEPSDDTLFNILALPKAGLAPGLKQGLKARLERYPRVDWPRPEPSDGTTPRTTTAVKDVEKGRLGSAARRLAGTAAVAGVDNEVVASLRDKHPAGAEDPFGPTDDPSSGDIPSEEDIMAAFKTFKPDTSPGLSGWTHHLLATALRVPSFLKAIHTLTGLIMAGTAPGQAMLCASRLTPLRKPDGWRPKPDTSPGLSGWTHHLLATALRVPAFLKAIHTLTSLIMAGTAPGQAMLCASRLTPLRKPDGGLRPIAVGDMIYRLATKAIIRHSNRRDFLLPYQFGVGSKGFQPSLRLTDFEVAAALQLRTLAGEREAHCTNCGETNFFGHPEVCLQRKFRRVARHEGAKHIMGQALASTPGTRVRLEPLGHQTSRRNDIQVLSLLGSQASGLANAEYDLTVVSLANKDARATKLPNLDTDPSQLVNKYLDSVADHKVRHRPTSNLAFHPIVLSLGGMMNGSTTKVFASWKRVMTRGTYNLMLKRLRLCLLQARVRSFEL
ncbi:hypothetical protein JCM24511_07343 [Saitozyma sp. JCM 24511]|nr:hypothetical protein JCM24511_07343 [Saitozyma sp. JCM 24511]